MLKLKSTLRKNNGSKKKTKRQLKIHFETDEYGNTYYTKTYGVQQKYTCPKMEVCSNKHLCLKK
jgi:hypothetical protein